MILIMNDHVTLVDQLRQQIVNLGQAQAAHLASFLHITDQYFAKQNVPNEYRLYSHEITTKEKLLESINDFLQKCD